MGRSVNQLKSEIVVDNPRSDRGLPRFVSGVASTGLVAPSHGRQVSEMEK